MSIEVIALNETIALNEQRIVAIDEASATARLLSEQMAALLPTELCAGAAQAVDTLAANRKIAEYQIGLDTDARDLAVYRSSGQAVAA